MKLLLRRTPPHPHNVLRRRLLEALVLVAVVDAVGTFLMWLFENDVSPGAIHNLWDAFFFTTVQLLTVSSQMPNPLTTGGRIVDIVLEVTALMPRLGHRRRLRVVLPRPRQTADELSGLRERLVAHGAHVPRLDALAAVRTGEVRHRDGAAVLVLQRHRLAAEVLEPQSMSVSNTG